MRVKRKTHTHKNKSEFKWINGKQQNIYIYYIIYTYDIYTLKL